MNLEGARDGTAVQVGCRGPLRRLVGINDLISAAIPGDTTNKQVSLGRIHGRHLKAGDAAIAIGPIAGGQQIRKADREGLIFLTAQGTHQGEAGGHIAGA